MKKLQTSLLALTNTFRSGLPIETSSRSKLPDERLFLRLKLYLAPYTDIRLELGEAAPEPFRILQIVRKGGRSPLGAHLRHSVVLVERKLFQAGEADWLLPTLVRLIRGCVRENRSFSDYLDSDPWAARLSRMLREVARNQEQQVDASPSTSTPRKPSGDSELLKIWNSLIEQYFPDQPELKNYRIVWSQRRHTSTLASCQPVSRIVRVASIMKHPEGFPYLEALLYHELCHAALGPIPRVNGRRVIHGKDFKSLEGKHPGIPLLNRWIRLGGWRALVRTTSRKRSKQSK